MREFLKKHYHWIIALVVLMDMFLIGGINNNLSGLFVQPVTEDLQISRGSFSWAIGMKSLASILSALLSGFFLKKFGYRWSAAMFLLGGACAMALMSLAPGAGILGVGAALYGMTEGVCATSGAAFVLDKWFCKAKGTVLGLVTAATGLGGSVLSVALSKIMDFGSWQSAYRFCGAALLVTAVLMALLCRDDPERLGRKPYGVGAEGKENKPLWQGFSMKTLLKRPAFYLLCLALVTCCTCVYFPFQTVVPHLQGRGLTHGQAVFMNSGLMILLALVKLGAGALCDWIGAKKVTVLCLLAQIGCLLVIASVDSVGKAAAGMVLLALALPIGAILIPLLTRELFGVQAQGVYIGIFVALSNLANMIAGPIVNGFYDDHGTYSPVYLVAATVTGGMLLVFLLSFFLAHRDAKTITEE